MTIEQIRAMQVETGVAEMQEMIDTGLVWKMEGSMGRAAMDSLRKGVCFLPDDAQADYYGNIVPSRHMVKPGTTGSLELSEKYWESHDSIAWENL